jgi:hypothetical protein
VSKGRARKSKRASESGAGSTLDRTPPWSIIYYRAAGGTVPALDFLDSCPGKLEGEFTAVLDAVAAEIRLTGPSREQFRLFCLLENGTDDELVKRGLIKPAIVVIDGRRKPWRTVLSAADYRAVKKVGEEHKRQFPRRIAM